MKKLIIGLAALIVGLIITVIVIEATKYKVPESTKEEIVAQFDSGEDFLLVIGGSTCHWCIKYKNETLPDYDQNDDEFPLYFIYADLGFRSQTDFQTFLATYGITYNSSPTSYLIKDGQLVAMKEGFIENDELNSWIDENK
ncbi:hypothetical protein [Haloplasma contractile]|uniref:Uncharacterized protein n=1 Tax=Haloplasma contractile SSD-17B TaxID=1033810 RepID=U2FGV6_9MOLU|nr:hypothetical protein [Haloplasma contractile]ERJ12085.1 hypothetical protein HLPCO_001999 [Haloplasma contractile SSD-17B]